MTRLRVLELPSEQVGEFYQTPFILILDQMDALPDESAGYAGIKDATGARGILAFTESVDLE